MRVKETFITVFESMLFMSILCPMIWFRKENNKEEVKTRDGRVFWLVKLGSKRDARIKDLCMPIGLVRVPWGPDGVVLCGPAVENKGVIYHALGLLIDEDSRRSVETIGAKLRADSFAVDQGFAIPLVAALREELRVSKERLDKASSESEQEMLRYRICHLEMRLAYL